LGGDTESWIDEQIEIGIQEDENERASVREELRQALQRLDEMCDHILEKNCEEQQEEADDERQEVDRADDNDLRAGANDAQMVEPECEEPGPSGLCG
jgi:dihydroxyacetone kinase